MQCLGASVVVLGIIVVLLPSFSSSSGNSQLMWSLVLVLSCIPNVLSSVYKEKALGETDVDVIYMNGWIAIWQFAICLPLAIPSAWASSLTVGELPRNIIDGGKCYMGENSIVEIRDGIPIDDCSTSFFFVTVYLVFNLVCTLVYMSSTYVIIIFRQCPSHYDSEIWKCQYTLACDDHYGTLR